ncbi:MAG: helix-turn-helix transcriptional regulator [Methylococcaceae bacterium]
MLVREKIKLLRHARKWSQEYIAEKIGMSPNGYGALERGDSSITLEKLEKIAQLLEVPLSELCDDGGNIFNLVGTNNHNTTTHFQCTVYSPECSEIKHELGKQLLINELKDKEISMKNEEIAGLKKIIALLEDKRE